MASPLDRIWYGENDRECRGCGDWVPLNTIWNGLCQPCRREAAENDDIPVKPEPEPEAAPVSPDESDE